jgi:hypothetical protein
MILTATTVDPEPSIRNAASAPTATIADLVRRLTATLRTATLRTATLRIATLPSRRRGFAQTRVATAMTVTATTADPEMSTTSAAWAPTAPIAGLVDRTATIRTATLRTATLRTATLRTATLRTATLRIATLPSRRRGFAQTRAATPMTVTATTADLEPSIRHAASAPTAPIAGLVDRTATLRIATLLPHLRAPWHPSLL